MARIMFNGMCGNTEIKISAKTGNPYEQTDFVDMDTMQSFSLFGKLGMKKSKEIQQFQIEGKIEDMNLRDVVIVVASQKATDQK